MFGHTRTSPGLAGLALVALLLTALLGGSCGSESELAAHQPEAGHAEYRLEFGEGWLRVAGDGGSSPVHLAIRPHTDLTLHLLNEGERPHRLVLLSGGDEVASTDEIGPGEAGMLRYHLHDPQRLRLADPSDPGISATLEVAP